jgi:hypothetical protein
MADLTKVVAKRIILSREIVKGQATQTCDLEVTSVNIVDGKHLVNLKGCSEKQYAASISLFRDGDLQGATNQSFSRGLFADAKFVPTAGMLVNVTIKSVPCRDGANDLRVVSISQIASAQTSKGSADDFEDDSE